MPTETPTIPTQDAAPAPGAWDRFKPSSYKNEPPIQQQPASPETPAPAPTTQTPPPAQPTTPANVAQPKPAGDSSGNADPDDEIVSGKRSPKSDDFKRVKNAATEARKKLEEIETAKKTLDQQYAQAQKELEQARANQANPKEIEELRAERDRLKGVVDAGLLESTQEFNTKYQQRFDEATSGLKAMLGGKSDDILAALQLPDGQHKTQILETLTEGLNEFQKGEIYGTNREIRKINKERSAELSQANEKLTKIAQERQAKAKEHQDRISREFDQTLAEFQDPAKGYPGFIPKAGTTPEDVAYNASVQERAAIARKIFTGQLDAKEMARQSAMASLAPTLIEQNKSLLQKVAQMEAAMSKMQSSSPSVQDGGRPKAVEDKRGWAERLLAPT